MRRVGLINIKVGNACASAHRNVPSRDAARRTTSLRNARAAGDILAALARLVRTVRLKRSSACGSETVWRLSDGYCGLPQARRANRRAPRTVATAANDVQRGQRS